MEDDAYLAPATGPQTVTVWPMQPAASFQRTTLWVAVGSGVNVGDAVAVSVAEGLGVTVGLGEGVAVGADVAVGVAGDSVGVGAAVRVAVGDALSLAGEATTARDTVVGALTSGVGQGEGAGEGAATGAVAGEKARVAIEGAGPWSGAQAARSSVPATISSAHRQPCWRSETVPICAGDRDRARVSQPSIASSKRALLPGQATVRWLPTS